MPPYGGASFRMMGSRTDPAGVVVTSQILRSEAPSIEVDWRLGVIDRRYKITDVAVMAKAWRHYRSAPRLHQSSSATADKWRFCLRQCASRMRRGRRQCGFVSPATPICNNGRPATGASPQCPLRQTRGAHRTHDLFGHRDDRSRRLRARVPRGSPRCARRCAVPAPGSPPGSGRSGRPAPAGGPGRSRGGRIRRSTRAPRPARW